MDCQTYQRWFSPYIDGALSAEERSQLEAHLATCPRCQTELVSLQRMLGTLKMMEQPHAPDLLPGVRRKLARQPWWRGVLERMTGPWRLPWHSFALAGTAAVALVAVGVSVYLQRGVQGGMKSNADSMGQSFTNREDWQSRSDSHTVVTNDAFQGRGDESGFPAAEEPAGAGKSFGGNLGHAEKSEVRVSSPPTEVTIAIPQRQESKEAELDSDGSVLAKDKERQVPNDSASCKAQGGVWGTFGLAQVQLCNMPTSDADKECTDAGQCESRACVAPAETAPGQPATGRCHGWTVTVGTCLNRVIGGQATGTLCED
ncbi:MAG: hypothetical protein COV75_02325 [Candidatus Omnitrophica bacterium CG11_big_fil_rev_8_21_14_0_20_63_9]|nr:MAG: hypothetical protein COV75_02325 [Candidatus Omnitrophica bacterium CG11_big_fil_rev_8_21_14_0_20_63_9]